jgi:hypothetical protein
MDTTKPLMETLLEASNYMPYVYGQLAIDDSYTFTIRYPFKKIPENSLLFVLPIRNSLATNNGNNYNKLKLLIPTVIVDPITGERSINYTSEQPKIYNIFLEGGDGSLTKLEANGLIANRLAIFRFLKHDPNTVILVNNPLYNNIQLTSVIVNQDATFRDIPVYAPDPLDPTQNSPLALQRDIIALANRIAALENKFLYGTEDADVALADKPDGSIYIKIEDDGN